LRSDGYFLITTPNLASWRNRIRILLGLWPDGLALIPGRIRAANKKTIIVSDPGHVRLYTLGALEMLLEYVGFDVLQVVGVPSKFYNIRKSKRIFRALGYLDSLFSKKPGLAWHLIVLARARKCT